MDSLNAFSSGSALWYIALIKGISALALAKYLSAFLTPQHKKRALAACLIGVAYFIFDYLMRYILDGPLNMPSITMLRNIAASALTFGASLFIFQRELGKQAFLLCSFAAIETIGLLLMSYIQYIFPLYIRLMDYVAQDSSMSPDRLALYIKMGIVAHYMCSLAVFSALLFLPLKAITRSFTYKNRRLSFTEASALILPCLPAFVIIYAVRVFMASAETSGVFGLNALNESYGAMILLSCVILLLTLIASVKLTQKSARLHIEEKNAAILREQIKELQKRDTDGVFADIRGMRHDMRNHLSNMRFLLKAGDDPKNAEALSDYLGRMDETLERFEFAYHTGSAVTDAVIHGRYLEARRKSIDFTSEFLFPASHGIDAYDLAVILQNALDNAVEACETVQEAERFIRLRSRTKAETFFVEVSNSYAGTIAFDDQTGLPVTSKPDAREHGLGVLNIKRSAEKYRGGVDIRVSEQVFTLTIVLQKANA